MDRGNLNPAGNPVLGSTLSELHNPHYARARPSHQPLLLLAALTIGFGMGSTWLMLVPDGMIELMAVGIVPLGLCAAFFRPRQ